MFFFCPFFLFGRQRANYLFKKIVGPKKKSPARNSLIMAPGGGKITTIEASLHLLKAVMGAGR